jgi:tRNA 2-thiouridine synthesizing protein A
MLQKTNNILLTVIYFTKYLEVYSMADLKIDVTGETCPVPLVELRKALKKASPGEIVEVVGTHPASKKEIPMAVEALGSELVDVEEKDGVWKIKIRK